VDFYEGNIFRPPSEANSLILQVTIGCTHNKCIFCNMYRDKKYRERDWREIEALITIAASQPHPEAVEKVFLADGDALAMNQNKLLAILKGLYEKFPNLKRVGTYAGPKSLLNKSDQQLRNLFDAGLEIIYLGLETGHSPTMKFINKGCTVEEMVEAGKKVKKAGIKLSVMVIGGIGGKSFSYDHAKASAVVINQMKPEYMAVLTLYLNPGTPLHMQVKKGLFQPLQSMELIKELKWFLEDLDLSGTIFRTNHASNYLVLGGTLNKDKEKIITTINKVLNKNETSILRAEKSRGL